MYVSRKKQRNIKYITQSNKDLSKMKKEFVIDLNFYKCMSDLKKKKMVKLLLMITPHLQPKQQDEIILDGTTQKP